MSVLHDHYTKKDKDLEEQVLSSILRYIINTHGSYWQSLSLDEKEDTADKILQIIRGNMLC